MRRISSNSESGAILAIVIILMLALTITGIAFLNAGVMEYRLAKREDYKNKAFYIAEGGLERTLWNLKQDFVNGNEDWTDGINEISVGSAGEGGWIPLIYDQTLLGDGSYAVKLKYVYDEYDGDGNPIGLPKEDEIWVKSTGTVTVKDVSRTVQVWAGVENFFPWNNAIFAKGGTEAGVAISGNSRIHGSIHILGEGLGSGDVAFETLEMIGKSGMRNNYARGSEHGMPDYLVDGTEFAARVPGCPTITVNENGEQREVETLGAKLRVKEGIVALSGTATVGEPDVPLDPLDLKETIDAAYVKRPYGGNQGVNNVWADVKDTYREEDYVPFPSLLDPYDVDPAYRHLDYLKDNSLHLIIGDGVSNPYNNEFYIPENKISSEVGSFTHFYPPDLPGDATHYIEWDQGTDTLTVRGNVYVEFPGGEAGSLDLGKKDETIEYKGNGVIVVAEESGGDILGTIRIHGNLLAQGTYNPDFDLGETGQEGFPHYVLGLVTGRLELATGAGEAKLGMTGAFFAENEIVSAKQNEVAGTFVSRYFNMGQNVPRIYQVPDLQYRVPPGMPGASSEYYRVITRHWSES